MKECPVCKYCFDDTLKCCSKDGATLFSSLVGPPLIGGRYQLEYRLGQGGMGAVYKARHAFLTTPCAIKVISRKLPDNDNTLLQRFRQEAVVAASIKHPNIVAVTDYDITESGYPFLVMEYVKGESLAARMKRVGRLPIAEALEVISPIAEGVGTAHSEGVVHRDLKPLNIMVSSALPMHRAIKVLDFGLAKIKSEGDFGSLETPETIGFMGSPHYMAPEQWSNEEPDHRADIYSLGIILYQLLVGHVPFQGDSLPSVMRQHLMDPPPSFFSLGLPIPPKFEKVLERALAKQPSDRPESMAAFVHELQEAYRATQDPDLDRTHITDEPFTEVLPAEHPGLRAPDTVYSLSLSQDEIFPPADPLVASFETMEANRLRLEVEAAQSRAEAARQRLSEAQQKAEQARRIVEKEAARRRAEDEALRLAREAHRAQEAAKEAHQRANEEASRRVEEFAARTRAEEEVARLAKEITEIQHRLEAERSQAGAEAQRLADVARREAQELVWRKQQEAEAFKKAETEAAQQMALADSARLLAEGEAMRLAQEATIAQGLAKDARQLAENEAAKRAEADAARLRAEQEVERLGREVTNAQQRVEDLRIRVEAKGRNRDQTGQSGGNSIVLPPSPREFASLGASADRSRNPTVTDPPWSPTATGATSDTEVVEKNEVSSRGKSNDRVKFTPGATTPRRASVRFRVVLGVCLAAFVLIGGVAFYRWVIWPRMGTGNGNAKLVKIGGGTFMMGGGKVASEQTEMSPAHSVTVETFWIDKTEVSMAEYAAFVRATKRASPTGWNGTDPPANQEELPVVSVSMLDAQAFAEWRSQQTGWNCQLPTDEEWEYAARSGAKNYSYPWGNEWRDGAENVGASGGGPKPVGSSAGETQTGQLKDMLGNVQEWTRSPFSGSAGSTTNPGNTGLVIVRGGSYRTNPPFENLLTQFQGRTATSSYPFIGFRLVCRP